MKVIFGHAELTVEDSRNHFGIMLGAILETGTPNSLMRVRGLISESFWVSSGNHVSSCTGIISLPVKVILRSFKLTFEGSWEHFEIILDFTRIILGESFVVQ